MMNRNAITRIGLLFLLPLAAFGQGRTYLDQLPAKTGSLDSTDLVMVSQVGEVPDLRKVTLAELLAGLSARLDDIAALTPTDGGIIVGTGSGWTLETGATARTSLGLGATDSVSFSALTTQGDATIGGDLLLGIGGGQNVTVSPPATSTERTYTLPDASGTLLLSDDTQTLTNKTIDGDDNTLQDIPGTAVDAATTSSAGVVELATDAEARSGTADKVPDADQRQRIAGGYYDLSWYDLTNRGGFTLATTTTGTGGAVADEGGAVYFTSTASASPSTIKYRTFGVRQAPFLPPNDTNLFGVSGQLYFTLFGLLNNATATKCWFLIGTDRNDTTVADPSDTAVGIRIDDDALKGIAHDGTTLTVLDLSTTYSEGVTVRIEWDGAGNVTWYLDGTSAGTTASGPTTNSHGAGVGWAWMTDQGSENVSLRFGTNGMRYRQF